jgi:hypothetical protein
MPLWDAEVFMNIRIFSHIVTFHKIWNIGDIWTKLVQGGLVQAGFGKRADLIIAADTVVELDVICSFLAT